MKDHPTGTVTFLFTDIEGSTQRWEKNPEAMQRAFNRQEQIIRDAVARHNGYAYKMIGDAFQVAFSKARDALDAAIDAQRELLEIRDWKLEIGKDAPSDQPPISNIHIRVRMALHTGVTEERGDDYVGPVLNRAARLMSAGHGGQILVSEATEALVRENLPANVTLRHLGERRLKDLTRVENVYQVVAADLPSDFPPLKTLDTLPNNLPIQLTSFIGREKEIEEVKAYLSPLRESSRHNNSSENISSVVRDDSRPPSPHRSASGISDLKAKGEFEEKSTRLLTLTGAGGCGKTRLSLQVAADLLDGFADGVWFIELAPLADPTLVLNTIANVLGVREEQGRPLLATLTDWLRHKRLLFVLDNCEHLIDACAKFADAVLRSSRDVRILATSREALGIAGESAYRVPSLTCPDPRDVGAGLVPAQVGQPQGLPLQDLTQFEAIRLFIERARQSLATFRVNDANVAHIAQICSRLDGIPLAIELAAARVNALSVEKIAERLDDRFRLLTSGSRTALPRQQTLRALIDWSHSLLSEPERVLLRRLAVFAGGCTLEAAEAVCADEDLTPVPPSLGGKGEANRHEQDLGKLQKESTDETIHEEGRIGRGAVLNHLARLVDKSLVVMDERPSTGSGQASDTRYRILETIRQYAREKLLEANEEKLVRDRHLNYLSARERDQFDETGGVTWEGDSEKSLTWLNQTEIELDNIRNGLAWAQESGAAEIGLQLSVRVGWFWFMHGRWGEARERMINLLEVSEGIVNPKTRGDAFFWVAWFTVLLGETKLSYPYFEQSITSLRPLGIEGKFRLAISLAYYGFAMMNQDLVRAHQLVGEGLAIARDTGNQVGIANSLNFLGIVTTKQGDYAAARRQLEECLAISRERGAKWFSANPLFNLGELFYRQSEVEQAHSNFEQALKIYREMGDKRHIALSLHRLGEIARLQGRYAEAEKFYTESLTVWQELGNKRRIASGLDDLDQVRQLLSNETSMEQPKAEQTQPQKNSALVDDEVKMEQQVEDALKHLHDVSYLGEHPLGQLRVVELHLKDKATLSFLDRGKALSTVLLQALQKIRPDGAEPKKQEIPSREWQPYIILHDSYVRDEPTRDIMARLYISEGTFNRTRRRALRNVAKALVEMERAVSSKQ